MCPLDLPDLSGLTLLVVDDNHDSLEMLDTFLSTCGAHVLRARNGATALAYIDQRQHIDAIVTDVSMPVMDGVELVRKLRARRPGHIPAIAVTGFYENYMTTAAGMFDAFLRKPLDLDNLCRTIRSVTTRG